MGIVEKLIFPSLQVPTLLQVGIWDWFGFVLGFFFCKTQQFKNCVVQMESCISCFLWHPPSSSELEFAGEWRGNACVCMSVLTEYPGNCIPLERGRPAAP